MKSFVTIPFGQLKPYVWYSIILDPWDSRLMIIPGKGAFEAYRAHFINPYFKGGISKEFEIVFRRSSLERLVQNINKKDRPQPGTTQKVMVDIMRKPRQRSIEARNWRIV